ncbi:hypothetical protein pZL12.103c [Streptomyces phage ZL12]|uniref:Uncharacterized protein n=1 Tax=Streptomyces phage ZL12 TaxID=2570911 RepID=D0UWK8_9CAUD|nr:hypothetical protein QEH43_gp103 [Streptomyces phage ZL12]ACX71180.1 hypothetical protein pZL12.103c [Streptomyces phage ZL12]
MPDEGIQAGRPPREPTPLEKNRALEEWLRWQLGQVQKRIRDLEAQEEQRRLRQAQGSRWKVQPQRSESPAVLHRADCTLYEGEGGFISGEDAVVALTMPEIEPCEECRPETGLAPG